MTRRQRIVRSREEVSRLLEEWKASGRSARSFGEERGIPSTTLYQWARKASCSPGVESGSRQQQFVAVDIETSGGAQGRPWFRLTLRNGRELQVPAGFDDAELSRLLQVLEG